MRFIIQDEVELHLPPDWEEKVSKAKAYVGNRLVKVRKAAEKVGKPTAELEQIVSAARHKAINAKASVWRAAGQALSMASHGKCWYCECRQDRSDKPVDHFRPKNSVVEAPGHPGYHWLAFAWENYRYSCTYCNSRRCDCDGGTEGGKQDHFPILTPPLHAKCETDQLDRPKLLDPTNDSDTKLLTFLPNGFPHPARKDTETLERVTESIRLYHLNHAKLVLRRKEIACQIKKHVDKAETAKLAGRDDDFRYHKKEIIKLIRPYAECSTAARVYLRAYRFRPWVEEILDRDI